MAKEIISRVIPVNRGDWETLATNGTELVRDDIVESHGSTYITLVKHTPDVPLASSEGSRPDQPGTAHLFHKITDGISFAGSWDELILYFPGMLVIQGAAKYACVKSNRGKEGHPSS